MAPYVRTPAVPGVALLTPEGRAVSEHGELLSLDEWPDGTRLWASYQTVYDLVRAGHGEALCWNHEEIRWRHERFEEHWTRRASDANVVKIPFDQLDVKIALEAFCRWRDWLGRYGASPTGTSGSAAWSLLRARLEQPLYTGGGERPPLDRTVGGRQQMGPAGKGRFEGPLVHLDLPAAYASTLAGLRYGGQWLRYRDPAAVAVQLSRYAGSDHPVFVRAKVRVPKNLLGPLVKRQRRKPRSFMESMLLGQTYPTGTTVQGVWTWEEVAAAEDAGAKIVKLTECWIHRSGHYPFHAWWEAIQDGRKMPGLAGQLAKVTGNALWGRFCMDASTGVRTIRSRNGVLAARPIAGGSQAWPAHDLAETVSGRVRARLYWLMVDAGDRLVSAHTDGAWLVGGVNEPHPESSEAVKRETTGHAEPDPISARMGEQGWRQSQRARRLDLLNPQRLRYWPDPPQPWEPAIVYAGMPAEHGARMFETEWVREFPA